jgi:protein involved in polysaccharide export with SLBB domain
MRHLLLGAVLVTAFAAPLSAQSGLPPADMPAAFPASSAPVLIPGDVVKVTVWGRAELGGDLTINDEGRLNHPILQEVVVAGVPLPVARQRLRTLLERFESNPQFVMQPLVRVAVGGEVRQPSLYLLPTETALYQVIATAGGPSERGRLDRVRLVRDGSSRVMDLSRADSPEALVPIRSGDRLMVERRRNVFREYILPGLAIVGSVASVVTATRRW